MIDVLAFWKWIWWLTRSRSYKKNDGCHVEQKNGALVRRVIGYRRYNSKEALVTLNRLYSLLRLYTNFFQPSMKLLSKHRNGAQACKHMMKHKRRVIDC